MTHNFRFSLRRLFLVIFAIAGALSLLRLAALYDTGRFQYPAWTEIAVGDSRQHILEMMGKPDFVSKEFSLWHEFGHEKIYAEARSSNAILWYRYHTGISHILTVGFGDNDKVVYKAEGDT